MAKKKKESKAGKEAPLKKGGGRTVLFMILFGCLVPFGIPTLIVCLGFLPTFITLFTETDPRRPALATIGYMNLAGVLPFIIELWEKGQTLSAAKGIVGEPSTWVIMLGAAGIGQLILYVVPQAVASGVIAKQEARRRVLNEGLEQLEAIWGKEVSNTSSIELVRSRQSPD